MSRGRPKRLFHARQMHLLVPMEDYRALEKGAAREAIPLPDYLRSALHQVAFAGVEVAPERARRTEERRQRQMEKHVRALVELLESEGPAA
jgi:hypothetical protein